MAEASTPCSLAEAQRHYAPEAYQSGDLDFVITLKGTGGEAVLAALGFSRKESLDFYRHPGSHFILEFPPGPLAVGDDLIKVWSTDRRDDELLYVLSLTDSCRDRLASFLFWNDFSGLEQAIAVFHARANEVDLNVIEEVPRRPRACLPPIEAGHRHVVPWLCVGPG